MDTTLFNLIRADLIKSEKRFRHPYLDIKGNVTTGIGFKSGTFAEFRKLDLINKTTGRPATPEEKQVAWDAMQREKAKFARAPGRFNRNPKTYNSTTNLVMTGEAMDAKLDQEITTRVARIKGLMGDEAWNRAPNGPKVVAVNLDYVNRGGIAGFGKFVDAFKRGDREAMARESLFLTDSESGARDLDRLTRNRVAITGEDEATARREIEKQVREADAKRLQPPPANPPAADSEDAPAEETGDGSPAEESDARNGFDRDAFTESLTRADDPFGDILLKDPGVLTEGELRLIMDRRQGTRDEAERERLFGIELAFFDNLFGAAPVEHDATGRLVQPAPVRPVNQTPVAARDADGRPIDETLETVARRVADLTGRDGGMAAVKALQLGLNFLNRIPRRTPDFNPDAGTGRERRQSGEIADAGPMFQDLKDDGVPGPKTRAALRQATAAFGRPRVEESLALGSFQGFARDAALGAAGEGDLRRAAETAFGPLFRKPGAAAGTARPEGFGVQMAVNDLGRDLLGGAFQPLKEDGDIGPRTADAFRAVVAAAGPERFTGQLGRSFGFFDDSVDA